jgi:hypothetical protein
MSAFLTGAGGVRLIDDEWARLPDGGTVRLDPGTGNRVRVARALQAGAASELIDAYLMEPVALS